MNVESIAIISALSAVFATVISAIVAVVQAAIQARADKRSGKIAEEQTDQSTLAQAASIAAQTSSFLSASFETAMKEREAEVQKRKELQGQVDAMRLACHHVQLSLQNSTNDIQELFDDHQIKRNPECQYFGFFQERVMSTLKLLQEELDATAKAILSD